MSVRRLLYSLLLYFIFPFVILKLLWRSLSSPAYRQRIPERLGIVKSDSNQPIIWLHAVSVGETIAAKPLIEALINNYPDYRVLVTTTTPTGSEQVRSLFSNRVDHVYYPYDLPEIIFRFLKRIKPHILIVVETEIWPNLYAACNKRDIPIVIVNARLSAKSTHAYKKIKSLVAETLSYVKAIAVRSKADAESFKQLGAIENRVQVTGNIKFDLVLDQEQIKLGKQRRKQWGKDRPVWVAASTHEGEDEQLLVIYHHLLKAFPDLLLVLVPRHPERFEKVYALSQAFSGDEQGNELNNDLTVIRHSQTNDYKSVEVNTVGVNSIEVNIIIGDTMGEMQSWFATASVVFMGGSLVETGGHNPLEPISQGVPVVSGPFMFNFDDVVAELDHSGLLTVCENDKEVEAKIRELLNMLNTSDGPDYQQIAQAIMQKKQGVTARLMKIISTYL